MKFTIDTENKEITLIEDVTFKEIEKIKKFIGKDAKNYTVRTEVKWTYYPYYVGPTRPWGRFIYEQPGIYYVDTHTTTDGQWTVNSIADGQTSFTVNGSVEIDA